MSKRVDYIDVIKGFAIFGVVWRHTACPSWLTLNFIFFILGGFFFKRKPLRIFIKEKVRYILLPFSFFYVVSYPFDILLCLWRNKTLANYNWNCIWDVFTISADRGYLTLNIPLWFLLSFFTIQILYYFISYLDKRLIIVISLLCLGLSKFILSVPTPFMINAAFVNLGFFALGNLVGKPWIDKLKDFSFRKMSLVLSSLLLAALFIPIGGLTGFFYSVAYYIKLFMAFFIIMSVASWFNEKCYLSVVRFYGENSLTILGLHALPLTLVKRKTITFFGECTPFMGFIQSVIVMAVMYAVILFCNKYIPFLVGKKVVTKEQPQEATAIIA